MSSEGIAALSTVLTALVSAMAGAVVLLLNTRASNREKDAQQKQNEYEKIISRYEKDLARREAHADNQQILIEKLQESKTILREQDARLRAAYAILEDYARRQYEVLKARNLATDQPPEAQEALQQGTPDQLDLSVKQVEQASGVLKKTRPRPPTGVAVEPGGEERTPAPTPTPAPPPTPSGKPQGAAREDSGR